MSFFEAIPLIGLVLLGALSPLLTFAALFQQKEWRLDRLREHLRRDGWWNQLFGNIRPVVMGLWLMWVVYYMNLTPITGNDLPDFEYIFGVLFFIMVLAGLSIIQIGLRKQRMPVWTSKALIITTFGTLISVAVTIPSLVHPLILPFTLLLQPLYVVVAWMIMKPVDFVLKKRVMDRAMHLRSQMEGVTVIGIAGSVGKTTVKELIAHLLQDLEPAVTPAHVNTEMGVAQWLTKQSGKGSNLLIVEMGAYRKGEIALLCRIAQPTIGVMTALGSDHLALFGSEQNIIDANGELIKALPNDGHAFFYGDNKGCLQLAQKSSCPITLTGSDNLIPTQIMETATGLEFSILNSQFSIPLRGTHNIHNALLAIAVARHMDIKEERIADLLQTFKPQAHTFTVTNEQNVLVLDDTYNISPLSMNAALDWATKQTARPRVLLTSGLQETGSDEAQYLEDLGSKASKCVERVIFTDKHGADIFAKAFGKPVEVLNAETERVETGSVLLAVGRMPLSRINRVLPTS